MTRTLTVILAMLIATPAFAQSPGTVNLIGPSSTPGAPQVTTVATVNAAINAALTAKADATSGVLTGPAITGGTISGTPISGAPGSFTTLGLGTVTGGDGSAANVTATGTTKTLAQWFSAIKNTGVTTYGVRADSASAPTTGGSGNAVGDALTISAPGCSIAPILSVAAVTGGAVTAYMVTNPGSCPMVPLANNLGPAVSTVASTTGSGTGATFNLSWAPIAAQLVLGTLPINGGDTYITNPLFSPDPGLYGTENTFVGYAAGGGFRTSSAFNTAMGHNACGIGTSGGGTGNNNACFGTDALRDYAGGTNITAIGGFALHDQATAGLNDITAVGALAMEFENNNVGNNHSAALGDSACIGVSGSASFRSGLCLGGITGAALTTAANFTIVGTGVGNTTFASGNDVLLVGTGATAVDTLAAGSIHYMNIANSLIGGLIVPNILTGFGTSPSVTGGTTTAAFTVNVGTGGTASSGTINMRVNAPTGYICQAVDVTNPATANTVATPAGQANVVLTNYSRTAGTLTAWAASDVIAVTCNGY